MAVYAAFTTPTDIFPNIGIPVISVVWNYTGLPPDDMAGRIISVFERSLSVTVNDIEHIESQSVPGYGIVKIFFQSSVNINAAQAQVTAISQTILKQMPPGVTPPQVLVFNASSVPIIQLALSSDKLSQVELNDLAQNFIRPALTTVAGAQLPYAYGGAARQIQIDLDQKRPACPRPVGHGCRRRSGAPESHHAGRHREDRRLRVYDRPQRLAKVLEDFNNLPIKVVDGVVVFMRDVASVHNGSPPQTNVVQLDGRKGVLMSVLKIGSASTLDIIAGVKSRLPAIQATLPPGVTLKYVGDQSTFVIASVTAVVREGLIAATLTGFMILVFLGSWRSTLIITVSIPLAVLSSLIMLSLLGQTINVMTLGGLALAVGILVDDATVTIENINRHMEEFGEDILTAITRGAQEIMPPATVALFCICIAFVPLLALGGVAGYLFRPLAMAVVFAMVASYILTYTLVPTMAHYLLRGQHHPSPDPAAGDCASSQRPLCPLPTRLRTAFRTNSRRLRRPAGDGPGSSGLVRRRLRLRRPAVRGARALPRTGLLPVGGRRRDQDSPSGADRNAHRGNDAPDRSGRTGGPLDRSERPPRKHRGQHRSAHQRHQYLLRELGHDRGVRRRHPGNPERGLPSTSDVVRSLREKLPRAFPGATFSFLPADIVSQILNFGSPAPLDVQISGANLSASRAFANKLLAKFRHVPGIADPRIQEAFQNPALKVDFNRELAGLVGLTEGDAAASIQSTLSGSTQTAPTYWLNPSNGVSYPVSVQTPQYDIDTMGELRNLPLSAAQSTQLLGGLATFSPEPVDALVSHYDIRPTVNVYATTQGRDLGGVAADVQKIVDEARSDLPRGSTVSIRGQAVTMTSAYTQLVLGLAMSVVLIYLLIVVNFQSWLDPFVIIMALPAALAGIVWMLFLTHTSLSVPALTGAIMCMGVATANSILVVSFAREKLAEGKDAIAAALEAGATRFRPVLMTALAMMIGMAPMAIEPGQNAPLGRAVIGGLLFATFATLLLVPALFSIAHGRRAKNRAAARHRSRPPYTRLIRSVHVIA